MNGPASKVRNRLAFGPTPGGIIDGRLMRTPYFNSGWNYVVSSTSSYPEITYLFTFFASSPALSTASIMEAGGYFNPFRGSHYDDDLVALMTNLAHYWFNSVKLVRHGQTA